MKPFIETIAELLASGYTEANVEEKLAQDVVLKALSESGFMAMLANPRMNWLKLSPQEATEKLVAFMRKLT